MCKLWKDSLYSPSSPFPMAKKALQCHSTSMHGTLEVHVPSQALALLHIHKLLGIENFLVPNANQSSSSDWIMIFWWPFLAAWATCDRHAIISFLVHTWSNWRQIWKWWLAEDFHIICDNKLFIHPHKPSEQSIWESSEQLSLIAVNPVLPVPGNSCSPFPHFVLVWFFEVQVAVSHQIKPGHTFKFSGQIWNEDLMGILIEGLYRRWLQRLDDDCL